MPDDRHLQLDDAEPDQSREIRGKREGAPREIRGSGRIQDEVIKQVKGEAAYRARRVGTLGGRSNSHMKTWLNGRVKGKARSAHGNRNPHVKLKKMARCSGAFLLYALAI